MKALKHVLIMTTLFAVLLFSSCANVNESKEEQYKLVTPTEQELNNIPEELDTVLGTHFRDYDCTKDNAYENSFCINHLHASAVVYKSEVSEYIAKPLNYYDTDSEHIPEWDVFVPQNDPLGKFEKIHEYVYDENGDADEDKAFDLLGEFPYYQIVIGHNKYSAPYLDWIVKDVWNGEVNHEDFMEFEDNTQLYYHDGFYYAPEFVGDRGGDGYIQPVIDNIIPIEDNKYEIFYHLEGFESPDINNKAVIGLKETQDGFRFWSVFSIDYDVEE